MAQPDLVELRQNLDSAGKNLELLPNMPGLRQTEQILTVLQEMRVEFNRQFIELREQVADLRGSIAALYDLSLLPSISN